ncbi:hypothetical protein A3H26_02135 [candidate division WWE3 bacterium RIFCSPLOWO2_12_FULL_36_10]|uniref:dTDP-4-dehydrorhamnose reductase n=1 Tax=candidate division WWE3 bacterium RIFCSPLOWO2_12_FULL_36_10 TaxID=1802630 RepID=A0A1F4VIX4_UNCKA|nr:MAG: hypothetical protein A3H26_02135 [candidate division WWE3 bacterium RIFCSPLOWO2_12_FULL_36_10]
MPVSVSTKARASKRKKVFVTGASGMLGTTLYKVFTKSGYDVLSTDLNPLDPWTKKLDIRNKRLVKKMVKDFSPDYVLNLAALTDLEYCEANEQESFDTNATGAINTAKICSEFDLPFVHISTAGVFDGTKKSAYTEEDIPSPINIYGKSKFESEKEIPKIHDKYYIFRAGWMMGSGDRDKKYVKKVLDLINTGSNVIYGLIDKFGCPTYTLDFAKGILKMISTNQDYGLYHMVSEGECARYDVSKKIVEVLGLSGIEVIPAEGEFFKKNFYVPRPANEVMINKKIHERGIKVMRNWEDAITDYLKTYYYNSYKDFRKREVFEIHSRKYSKKEPLVSIVTTGYKNEKFNEKYFNSINKQTYKNIEVIFVDNSSPDNTVSGARKMLKNGKIVASKINSGCAGGNNIGAMEASGKYIFLMGPDAWADENCVEELVKAAEKNGNYIYSPSQMSYDGLGFISCGIAADIFGYPARTYTKDGRIQTKRAFYADGTGVFMTKKAYMSVWMMDEETFLFAEDVDLSWKAHMMGMDVIPVKSSVIYHYSSGSVGIGGFPKEGIKYETNNNRRFLAERNIIRNIIKNYKWWNILWVLTYYILINIFEMLAMLLTGQLSAVKNTYLKAYAWNIANIKTTMNKRKIIQKTRKVGDFEVMKKMYLFPHKFLALLELGVPKVRS